MRIRHYFSQLALNTQSSYDLQSDDPKCQEILDAEIAQDLLEHRSSTLPNLYSIRNVDSEEDLVKDQSRLRKCCRDYLSFGNMQPSSPNTSVNRSPPERVQNSCLSPAPHLSPLNLTSKRATSTTKALIERTRSRACQIARSPRPSTLPRRLSMAGTTLQPASGIFIKAHEQKKTNQATLFSNFQQNGQVHNQDHTRNDESSEEEYESLENSYNLKPNFIISRSQSVDELYHIQNEKPISSTNFINCTLPWPGRPIRSVLTVQEKLAQDLPSIPPQAEVYMNLLEDNDDNFFSSIESSSFSSFSYSKSENSLLESVSGKHSGHRVENPLARISSPRSDKGQFDLAKLLDPFEKLEMEFKWDDVTPLRPPSAFGGHHLETKDCPGDRKSEISCKDTSQESFVPPPSFSRLPPDGHEFPPEYIDPSNSKLKNSQKVACDPQSSSLFESSDSKTEKLLGTNGVKAKIALFSNSSSSSHKSSNLITPLTSRTSLQAQQQNQSYLAKTDSEENLFKNLPKKEASNPIKPFTGLRSREAPIRQWNAKTLSGEDLKTSDYSKTACKSLGPNTTKTVSESNNQSATFPLQNPELCSTDIITANTCQEINIVSNPRILKKDSIEAINRRNIIESCRTRSGSITSSRSVEGLSAPTFLKGTTESEERPESRRNVSTATTNFRTKNTRNEFDVSAFARKNVLTDNIDGGKSFLESIDHSESSRKCISVKDVRRSFEKTEHLIKEKTQQRGVPNHSEFDSIDATKSEDQPHFISSDNEFSLVPSNLKEGHASITSIASTTSLISPQELQYLIDDTNLSLEEPGSSSQELKVVVLHRELHNGSVGITLAGGADYENKEITVHRVIPGTLAERDGRILKGDRVLSINGKSTKGVTHRDALAILKAPRAEVVLVLSRSPTAETPNSPATKNEGLLRTEQTAKTRTNEINCQNLKYAHTSRGLFLAVTMKKESTGLGFSLDGGRDSPYGDKPLTIKKIFLGGVAEKTGKLSVGDEILTMNKIDLTGMTRIEAWNFMKKLPNEDVTLVVRRFLTYKDKIESQTIEKDDDNVLIK